MKSVVVRIAMYAGKGANPPRLSRLLRRFGFSVSPVQNADLPGLRDQGYDLLYLPGGWYRFQPPEIRALRAFVRQGGGCVGTCAGAYNVAGFIPLIPGQVLRPSLRGRFYMEPQQGAHPILRGVVHRCTRHKHRRWEPIAVTLLGGPFILPKDPATIIASYDAEGTIGALVAAEVGRGRAVAMAPHPEHPLAALPRSDNRHERKPLPQGDTRLIIRNAVLWAARRRVPKG